MSRKSNYEHSWDVVNSMVHTIAALFEPDYNKFDESSPMQIHMREREYWVDPDGYAHKYWPELCDE